MDGFHQAVTADRPTAPAPSRPPGQIVLVFQSGGALGAYQVGVYQAMHEAGIEPDWVIGTSIGAINGAIIAGNEPHRRLEQLARFWESLQGRSPLGRAGLTADLIGPWANLAAQSRWQAGYADTRDAIAQTPWICEVDPLEGVIVHEHRSNLEWVAEAETL